MADAERCTVETDRGKCASPHITGRAAGDQRLKYGRWLASSGFDACVDPSIRRGSMKTMQTVLAAAALLFSAWVSAASVNVNTANAAQLEAGLSGVGATIAERIVEERKANGPFKDAADLQTRVKGIGPATVEKNAANLKFKD
jgi:competence protein ComEA